MGDPLRDRTALPAGPTPDYLNSIWSAQLLAQAEDWSGVLDQAQQVQRLVPEPTDGKVPDLRTSAALLEIQARMRLLASAGDSESTRSGWRAIEARLAALSAAGVEAGQVQLLRVQAAMFQGKHAGRDDARPTGGRPDGRLAAMLLRAQLCVDEGKGSEAAAAASDGEVPAEHRTRQKPRLAANRQNKRSECEAAIRDAMSMDKAGRRSRHASGGVMSRGRDEPSMN